jgi:hypothetical protein
MNLQRRSVKRRRSASGSDSLSGGGGDNSVGSLHLSGPVLSPPPGLGRSLKAAGAGTAGPLGPTGEVGSPAGPRGGSVLGARPALHGPRRPGRRVTPARSASFHRPRGAGVQVASGSSDPHRNHFLVGHTLALQVGFAGSGVERRRSAVLGRNCNVFGH